MANDRTTKQLIQSLAFEAIKVAACYNVIIDKEELQQLIVNLTKPEYSDAYFSMKYDFDEGKALELVSIYENSILLAKENDLVLSYIPDLLGRLRYMENCVIHVDKSLLLKPLRLSNAKSLDALK